MSEQKAVKGFVNGVNVDELFGTIEAVKGNADIAKFKFQAKHEWVQGGFNRTKIDEFYGACETQSHKKPFVIEADEHEVLLGTDRGANPVEYALTALAGCLTSSLIYHAAARGVEIKGVEAKLEGDIDLRGFLGVSDTVRKGYENIRVSYKIDADVSEEEKEALCKLATKYSPVFDLMTKGTPVDVSLKK